MTCDVKAVMEDIDMVIPVAQALDAGMHRIFISRVTSLEAA